MSFHSGCAAFHSLQRLRLTARCSQERVTYNKEIQTTDEFNAGSASDDETSEPLFREREATVDPERALERLEEESATLDREIEEEIRGLSIFSLNFVPLLSGCADLTEEEKTSIIAAPEFLDFVEQSSKIVQRALNDNYDYIRDYTSGAETGGCVPSCTASELVDLLSSQ